MSKSVQKFVGRTFLKGLTIVVPLAAAGWVMVWLFQLAESGVKGVVGAISEDYYIPGMGLVFFVGLIFLTGLLMYPWLTRRIGRAIDGVLRKIPIFGSVYSPVRDLMNLLDGGMGQELGQPVMVTVPNTNMETLGFITRRDAAGLPEGFLPEGHLVVYVQWSSQVGGYCFIVPEESVRPLDITVEEGMRWALTGGLSAPQSNSAPEEGQSRDAELEAPERQNTPVHEKEGEAPNGPRP